MSIVANDNRGQGYRDTNEIPFAYHVRLMRPTPSEVREIRTWRKGDFALAISWFGYRPLGQMIRFCRILAAQPHPEAQKIHEMEMARGK